MAFKIILHDAPAERKCVLTLPCPPFLGLKVKAAWLNGDYVVIDDIFWNGTRFECYAAETEV